MDFRSIPSIDSLLEGDALKPLTSRFPRELVAEGVRVAVGEMRDAIHDSQPVGSITETTILNRAESWLAMVTRTGLPAVVNATGIVLHTNLGRAVLGHGAREALVDAATRPTALEIDLTSGSRGRRDDHVLESLRALTGAEDGLVVNNNAAALMLAVDTLAQRREVIVSRGELIEIGGSFRLPDLLRRGRATLVEVGTTNRTRVEDYASAITRRTALILRVHPSNYRVEGFTEKPSLSDITALAADAKVPLLEDLGSGALLDLRARGLPPEPTVRSSIETGVDLVCFSGDKLLGGPQAGLVVGRADLIQAMQNNPLKRALRVDKLILAALRATLVTLRTAPDPIANLPSLRLLARDEDTLDQLAHESMAALERAVDEEFSFSVIESTAEVGSGSQPGFPLPSRALEVRHTLWPASRIAAFFRDQDPSIIGRINSDTFLLDVRAVDDAEDLVPNTTKVAK